MRTDGISDIEFDLRDHTCTFRVTDPNLDYAERLNQLSQTNRYIVGYQFE